MDDRDGAADPAPHDPHVRRRGRLARRSVRRRRPGVRLVRRGHFARPGRGGGGVPRIHPSERGRPYRSGRGRGRTEGVRRDRISVLSPRAWLRRTILVALVAAAALFVRHIDLDQLGDQLARAHAAPLVGSAALAIAMLACKATCWRVLLAPRHVVSLPRLLRYTV